MFVLSANSFFLEVTGICAKGIWIWLVSSVKLGGRKDIQFVKSAQLIYIQSLKPASYLLSRGIMIEVKSTNIQELLLLICNISMLSNWLY